MRDPHSGRTRTSIELELEARVARLEAELGQAFSVEEMDAIREQLVERASGAEEAYEQLEWKLRMELARVREAEETCTQAAAEMRRTADSLAMLLGEEPTEVTPIRMSRRRMLA